jgi:hypothetical protein
MRRATHWYEVERVTPRFFWHHCSGWCSRQIRSEPNWRVRERLRDGPFTLTARTHYCCGDCASKITTDPRQPPPFEWAWARQLARHIEAATRIPAAVVVSDIRIVPIRKEGRS